VARTVLTSLRFDVVVTARSAEKGQRIVDSCRGDTGRYVSYVVVEDITKDGAFDEVSQQESFTQLGN